MLNRLKALLNPKGQETPDPTPIQIPLGYNRPPTLHEQIQRLIRTEMSDRAAADGHETFEEADDFDVGDDFDPVSPWELNSDQESQMIEKPTKKPKKQEPSEKPKVKDEPEPKTEPLKT